MNIRFQNADDAYAEFRRLRDGGDAISFEEFCERHPTLAEGMRWLHSVQSEKEVGAGSESESRSGASEAPLDDVWKRFDELGLRVGSRVGAYELQEVLGSGGFGTVFRATREEPVRTEVALKVLRTEATTSESLIRFRIECQALATMEHPGIARLIDAGVTELKQPYYVMEFVRGGSITKHCDEKSLGIDDRLALFARVLQAVAHAHTKGFIHRDLKPQNVLVACVEGEAPAPKIIDFGLTKVMGERLQELGSLGGQTRAGELLGTPAYMSPEQITDPVTADTRSDVYALGVILFQLLTGALPFRRRPGKVSAAEIERIVTGGDLLSPSEALRLQGAEAARISRLRRTDPRTLRRALRGDLSAIVGRAMARRREDRYPSAATFLEDLECYRTHRPVTARAPGVVYTLGKFVRRNRIAVGAAAVAILIAAVSLLGVLELRRQEVRQLGRSASRALEAGDLEAARSSWAALRTLAPASARERKVGASVMLAMVDRAREAWADYRGRRRDLEEVERRARAMRMARPAWAGPWELSDEIGLWRKAADLRRSLDMTPALRLLHEAYDLARDDPQLRQSAAGLLEDVYLWRYREYQSEDPAIRAAETQRRMVEQYGTGRHAAEISGVARLRLASAPAGARIYCFRFAPLEGRSVPRPFHPDVGVLGEPYLEVEKVWFQAGPHEVFREGDRLIQVEGHPVRTRTELAATLEGVGQGESVTVSLRRGGSTLERSWVPFDKYGVQVMKHSISDYEPGRIVNFYYQFGFTLAGYPLERRDENLLGVTARGRPIEVELPRGSYLLVFVKDGHATVRFPVAAPRARRVEGGPPLTTVHLPSEVEVPEGFVWIPAGDLATGGDPEAFQPFPRGVREVPGFFMARLEVGVNEWRDFVNHPEILPRLDDLGVLRDAGSGEEEIWLVPSSDGQPSWSRDSDSGEWIPPELRVNEDWPVLAISRAAARVFAAWRSRRAAELGQPFTYRLPSDEEWERAARGVDRRIYPWGDLPILSHAWTYGGMYRRPRQPATRGVSPLDESVFGVRDLAGSNSEATLGTTRVGLGVYRGGSWNSPDEFFQHCATRNGLGETGFYLHSGVRLVAERR